MSSVNDWIDDFGPLPPPCFANRFIWFEFLKSAAAAQVTAGESKVFVIRAGERVFNKSFDFCADCNSAYMHSMQEQRRCVPGFLKQQEDGEN